MWRQALEAVETWEADGADADRLDEHAAVVRAALAAGEMPADQRAGARHRLGQALRRRYLARADRADLDGAIDELRSALEATPDDDAELPRRVAALGPLLITLAGLDGERIHVDEAVALARGARDDTGRRGGHPPAPVLTSLALGLLTLAESFDDPAGIDEAVDSARASLALLDGAPAGTEPEQTADAKADADARIEALFVLGGALVVRHSNDQQRGRIADLDEAVERLGEALELTGAGASMRPMIRCRLVNVFLQRGAATGDRTDVDAAVEHARLATAETPPGHLFRASTHMTLAFALAQRWEEPLSRSDADEAIGAAWAAWEVCVIDGQREVIGALLAQQSWLRAHHWYGVETLDEVIRVERAVGGEGSSELARAVSLRASLTGGDGGDAAHEQAVATLRAELDTAEDGATWAELAKGLGALLLARADPASVAAGVELLEQALGELPSESPVPPDVAMMLGGGLALRAGVSGSRADAERAVSLTREALEHHRGSSLAPAAAGMAGTALSSRYKLLGGRADLDAAVAHLDAAVTQMAADDPLRGVALASLSEALQLLHRSTGDEEALDRAIDVAEAAVLTSPPERQAVAQLQLAAGLQARADRRGDPRAARQAQRLERQAVGLARLLPAGLQADQWDTIHANHLARYYRTGEPSHLDEAIRLYEAELADLPAVAPERSRLLVLVAESQRARHESTHRSDDIDRAVHAAEQALEAAATPLRRAAAQGVLGEALRARFEVNGDLADIDAAVACLQEADATLVAEGGARAVVLGALSAALARRVERTGEVADAHAAVARAQAACDAVGPEAEVSPAVLAALATALWGRYVLLGDRADLDRAVTSQRQALSSTALARFHDVVHHHNLGGLLLHRYARSGDLADLDGAIAANGQALAALPSRHPARPAVQSGRAILLVERASATGDGSALREAIRLGQRSAMASSGADRAARWHVYAQLLLTQVEVTGSALGLRAAVRAVKKSLRGTSEHDAKRAARLSTLAVAFEHRHRRTGRQHHRAAALAAADEAASSIVAPSDVRLQACRLSGHLHRLAGHFDRAASAYRVAVEEVLPQLAWRGLGLASQQSRLREFPGLASDAAAVALDAGDPLAALGLLEQGRTLIWSQVLDARTDRSRLAAAHPELCGRLDDVIAELAAGDGDDGFGRPLGAGIGLPGTSGSPAVAGMPATQAAIGAGVAAVAASPARQDVERRWQLRRSYDELLAEVRRLPGFEDFLAPPPASALHRAAEHGPVVVVNVSTYRCDALLLTPDSSDVHVLALPGLRAEDVEARAESFAAAVHAVDTSIDRAVVTAATGHIDETLAWLWGAIAEPVLDALALGSTARSEDADPDGPELPRLWWCPTGQLARLPLHAAGAGGAAAGGWVGGRVVSSYTPTLGTLDRDRDRDSGARTAGVAPAGALIVGVADPPAADGLALAPLGGVDDEIALVAEHVAGPHTILRDADATCAVVLDALDRHPVVHFACHGHQDITDPAASYLAVADGPLRLRDVVGRLGDRTQLAFLSACETARGHPELADEVLHLAAAFGFSGARHVIGTLWSIDDASAPAVANDTYAAIATSGLDSTAVALHSAVTRLRRLPGTSAPVHWAPYVHFGP